MNRFLPFTLTLLVILTGQGVAASRGMESAAGQMVLCTGAGPVVVYVDADGQPTQPPHFCPEYALTLLGALLTAPLTLSHAAINIGHALVRNTDSLIAALVPNRPARAPPLSI